MSSPAPPSMTLTALEAVIWSSPEPVTTFSIPHSTSDPLWLEEALPRPWKPVPRSTVMLAVIAAMSRVSLPPAPQPPSSSPQ